MRIEDLTTPLVEAREAPLYHWVDHKKLVYILSKNSMPARFTHTLPETNKKVMGNSMTRNPKFYPDNDKKVVRLTFDQGKLAHTHKIIPLDAERTYWHNSGISGFTPDRYKELEHERLYGGTRIGPRPNAVMAEEFVLGDIDPLNVYLTEIFVFDPAGLKSVIPRKRIATREKIIQMVHDYGKQYGIPIADRLGK